MAQFPGSFYRTNVAIIDIAYEAYKQIDIDRLKSSIKQCRFIVIDSKQKIIFDRTYYTFVQHLMLGFTTPGTYSLNIQLQDSHGYVNSKCVKLNVKILQTNFNIGVIDRIRWPQLIYGTKTLKDTAIALKEQTTKLNIAGMKNATLYNTTKTANALYLPAYDSTDFTIATYDAAKPNGTKTHGAVLDISNSDIDLLTLSQLQTIKLVDSNSMFLPQYGGQFFELQFDLSKLNGKFELTLSSYKYGPNQTFKYDFENETDLLFAINNFALNNTKQSGDLKFFSDFTYTLFEVYDEEVADVANSTGVKTSWHLYMQSKLPMPEQQYIITGPMFDIEDAITTTSICYTDSIAATCVIRPNYNADIQGDQRFVITYGSIEQDFTSTIAASADASSVNLRDLFDKIQAWSNEHSYDIQLQCLDIVKSDDFGNYETDAISKFAMYSDMPLKIESSAITGYILYDVPRLQYCTLFENIDNGSTVTVGSYIVCVPDETTYAFDAYDVKWSVTYHSMTNEFKQVQTSIKWLLKFHPQQIGDYDIELQIIDPITKTLVKKVNKSVIVSATPF